MLSEFIHSARRRYERDGVTTVVALALLHALGVVQFSVCEGLARWRQFFKEEALLSYRTELPLSRRIRYYRLGFLTSSVVMYDFESEAVDDYLNFLEVREAWDVNDVRLSDHKHAFDRLLRDDHAERLPDVYALVRGSSVFGRDGTELGDDVDDWVADRLSPGDRMVLKPEDGYGGEGVLLLERDEDGVRINGDGADPGDVAEAAAGSTYLATEFVEQAEYAADVFPDATNTIRILTLWDDEADEPFVADAIHRFGVSASEPVDNWDKGGLSVGISLETGELRRGTRTPDSTTVEWYDRHPDTGAQITGRKIPDWDGITSAVCEMAEEMWYMPMIAWDVTPTEDGFKVIEGNARPTLDMMQVHRPLLRDERTRRFFERHDVLD